MDVNIIVFFMLQVGKIAITAHQKNNSYEVNTTTSTVNESNVEIKYPWCFGGTSGARDQFVCMDNTRCNINKTDWSCCNEHGGRLMCPSNLPFMCRTHRCSATITWCVKNDDGLQSCPDINYKICSISSNGRINNILLQNNSDIQTLHCTKNISITGSIYITENVNLSTINFSNLSIIETALVLFNNSNLVTVNFASLTFIGGFVLFDSNNALSGAKFQMLNHVSGFIAFHNNKMLNQINFPVLKNVGDSLRIANNTVLIDVAVPRLERISGSLELWRNDNLPKLLFPRLLFVNVKKSSQLLRSIFNKERRC